MAVPTPMPTPPTPSTSTTTSPTTISTTAAARGGAANPPHAHAQAHANGGANSNPIDQPGFRPCPGRPGGPGSRGLVSPPVSVPVSTSTQHPHSLSLSLSPSFPPLLSPRSPPRRPRILSHRKDTSIFHKSKMSASALRPNQRERASSRAANTGGTPGLSNGLIDPTKVGKYPVILSDTLLNETQKDVFTGVRYNHKPQLSSDSAPAMSKLKPETPGNKTNFGLAFNDTDGGKYAYAGTRSTDSSQYVLYFDNAKKAFILDRLDSTFNMNLTRTPDNTDPESLRKQFQHLDTSSPHPAPAPTPAPTAAPATNTSAAKSAAAKSAPKAASSTAKPSALKNSSSALAKNRKSGTSASLTGKQSQPTEKKKEVKSVSLALPKGNPPKAAPPLPTKPEKKKKSRQEEEDEEDDEDEDDGLTIEYPDDPPRTRGGADFSPAFPAQQLTVRRFSEFLRDSEADDADAESDEEDGFKLPSPVNNAQQQQQQQQESQQQQQQQYIGAESDEDEDDEDDQFEDVGQASAYQQQQQSYQQPDRMEVDMDNGDAQDDDMDLEAELEDALAEAANSGDAGEESEVSEED